ncbi:TonB-dependent receptor, partial [Zobellia sp.]|nr:TonB-dependent receptor [Zobellia sp.]
MLLFSLVMLLFGSVIPVSQNCDYTLSGTVIDLHDNSVLPGALLIVAGTEQAVETDIDGKFTITGLCDNTYSIQVSHPYCATQGFTLKVSGNTTKTFRLEHHLDELNEVIIKGKTYQNEVKTIVNNEVSTQQLEQFSNGSFGDALNSLSGVSSLNTGNAVVKPMIHGLHSSRVVIINNGVRMEDQEWGAEHAPNIDVNSIANLTLIKGAGALQYGGDAIGGVIVAEALKVPVKDSLYGKTIMNFASNGRGSSVTSQLTKSFKNGWYATAQGSVKRYGDFEAPDYVLSNTGIFERSASLHFGVNRFKYGLEGYYSFFKNDIGILRASHLGGASDQLAAISSDRPLVIKDFTYDISEPRQDVTHHLARIKMFAHLEGLGKLSLQYDFQQNDRLEYDIRIGDDADQASLDLKLDTHTVLLDLNSQLSDKINLKTGLMGRYQNNFANPDTGIRRLIPDYDMYNLGAYAITDYDLNENFLIELGARFDYTYMDAFKFYRKSTFESRNYDELYPDIVVEETDSQILTNPQLNFYNTSATLGATYSFDDEYKVFFNYSLAARAPNPSELFSEGLHHSASRIEVGDLGFQPEVAHKIAVTLERKSPVFSFSINPFINSINDFMVIEPTSIEQTIRGNFQVWEYRQTDARLLGFDVDASYAFADKFRLDHQFSFVKGYDQRREEPLISMPPVNTKNSLVYQNPNINNLQLALQSEY